jgi:hypothetical protein
MSCHRQLGKQELSPKGEQFCFGVLSPKSARVLPLPSLQPYAGSCLKAVAKADRPKKVEPTFHSISIVLELGKVIVCAPLTAESQPEVTMAN